MLIRIRDLNDGRHKVVEVTDEEFELLYRNCNPDEAYYPNDDERTKLSRSLWERDNVAPRVDLTLDWC